MKEETRIAVSFLFLDECVQKFRNSDEEAHYSLVNKEDDCKEGEWREFHNFLEKLEDDNNNPPTDEDACKTLASSKGVPGNQVKFAYAIYGKQKECLVTLNKPVCELAGYTRVNHLGNGGAMKASNFQWELPHFYSGIPQKCVLRMR